MKTELMKIEAPELALLEKSKSEQITETFKPMAEMLNSFEEKFNEILTESQKEITKDVTQKAKRLRLDIGKVRIETGKLKDKQKEYIKLEDKAIMGVHNILVWAVKEKEDRLKEIEDYFDIQEQRRLDALQSERVELLSKYVSDAHERQLFTMETDVWEAYLSTKKKEFEDRIEAEKQAELERIAQAKAEAEAREKQRLENERLKAEAEKRELEIEAERKKQADILAKQKAEADRLAKIEADKQAKIQSELDAKLKAEQQAKAKLEAELKAKRDAEIKAEQERLEAERLAKLEAEKLAKAPIKNQLKAWVETFNYGLEPNNETAKEIIVKFNSFKNWAKNEIEKL